MLRPTESPIVFVQQLGRGLRKAEGKEYVVIIDFIDMDDPEDKQKLLDELNERMKEDRVRITVMGMTQLGLVELTRKKVGHDLSSVIEKECPYCGGKGKTPVDIMEMLQKSRDS